MLSLVDKTRIAENGEFNFSGERYIEQQTHNSHFPQVKLGDVCELVCGGTPSKANEDYWTNGTVKWISSKHINGHGTVTGFELITKKALKESSTKLTVKNSVILITRVSVGKFAFADDDYAINQDLTAVIPKNEEVLLPKYLLFISKKIADVIDKNAQGIGVRGVTKSFLSDLNIPLPPIDEQKAIVAEIESYQKIIDGARQVVENYQPCISVDSKWKIVELGEVCEGVLTGPFGHLLIHKSEKSLKTNNLLFLSSF